MLNTGIPITLRKLTGLRGLYDNAVLKFSKAPAEQMDNTTIFTFVDRFKRGSKSFKRVFREQKSVLITNNMIRFADNTETIIGLELSEKLNASWNISYLDNSLRTFIYKLHNNALSYNHVITHFANNIEPYCTFCIISRHNNPERDTALHVFYSCPFIEPLNESYFSWLLGTHTVPMRSQVFGAFQTELAENNTIIFIATKILQKYIWDSKLRKTVPVLRDAQLITLCEFNIFKKVSKKLNDTLDLSTINSLK